MCLSTCAVGISHRKIWISPPNRFTEGATTNRAISVYGRFSAIVLPLSEIILRFSYREAT